MTNGIIRIARATSEDMSELDQAYLSLRPTDPDRGFYKLLFRIQPSGIFIARRNGKLESAMYCMSFPTGSGCIGGFFAAHKEVVSSSDLLSVQRCLLHLMEKGCTDVFASLRSENCHDAEMLLAAGFRTMCTRRIGITEEPITQKEAEFHVFDSISERSSLKEHLWATVKNRGEEEVITAWFWPHKITDYALNNLLVDGDSVGIGLSATNGSCAIVRISDTVHVSKRHYILPSSLLFQVADPISKVGEIMLAVGDEQEKAIANAVMHLKSLGIRRIYSYEYELKNLSTQRASSFWSYEKPQLILHKSIDKTNAGQVDASKLCSSTLDKYIRETPHGSIRSES